MANCPMNDPNCPGCGPATQVIDRRGDSLIGSETIRWIGIITAILIVMLFLPSFVRQIAALF